MAIGYSNVLGGGSGRTQRSTTPGEMRGAGQYGVGWTTPGYAGAAGGLGGGAGGAGGVPQVSMPGAGGMGGFGGQAGGYGGQPGAFGGQPGAQPTTTQLDFPEAQPYDPFGGNPELERDLGAMSEYGRGLMDPESDYYKRLSAEMQRQIGGQAGAQQRSAALRGAWGGLGGGMGGEVMQTQADIGQAGLEAQGRAESGLALQAPQIGAGMLQSTFQPQLGLSGLGEGSRQFGAGMGEQSRQFGAGLGLQQQQMAQQAGQFGAGMDLQYQQMAQQAEQANQQAYLQELALQYGAY